MSLSRARRRGQGGQAQLLTATVLATVILTGALLALEYAQTARKRGIVNSRTLEIRQALDAGIQHASHLYRDESSCDPVLLDDKLSRLNLDGTINPGAGSGAIYTRRAMDIPVSGRSYRVHFGEVRRSGWRGGVDPTDVIGGGGTGYNTGTSQDASVTAWVSIGENAGAQRLNPVRVVQIAALINNCNYPCGAQTIRCTDRTMAHYSAISPAVGACASGTVETDPCSGATSDLAIAYNQWLDDPNRPNCNGGRHLGDLTAESCPPASAKARVHLADVVVLRNYLRSGDLAGTCREILLGDGSGAGAAGRGCADLNGDGLVNETDLNILEKSLRGYLTAPYTTRF